MPPQEQLDLDLTKLAKRLASQGPLKKITAERRVRLLFNGQYIGDSTDALFVWEHEYYPFFYLPKDAFDPNFVSPGEDIKSDGGQVVAKSWTITVKDRSTSEAFELLAGPLKGYVKVQFHAVDTWMEEDTPIQVHPKDPFKRIDIVHSRRHIRVFVGGKVVADTTSSMHLFETGLPTRYYMPLSAVDQTVLRPTKTRSQCPYKGESEYYSVVIDGKEYKDVVWYYTNPKVESAGIAGLVCFYNEKVEIEIDGKKEPKRQSPWS